MSLRSKVIKLAHANPELRDDLLPLLHSRTDKKDHDRVAMWLPSDDLAEDVLMARLNEFEKSQDRIPAPATRESGRPPYGTGNLRYWIQFLSTGEGNSYPGVLDKMIAEANGAKLAAPELAPIADDFIRLVEYKREIWEPSQPRQARSLRAPKRQEKKTAARRKSVFVQVRDLPGGLQKALKSVGYHRRDIGVEADSTFKPSEAGLPFEGNRGYVVVVDIPSGRSQATYGSWSGPNIHETKQVDADSRPQNIPPNGAVIMGESGGRGNFATIRVRPDNLAAMLPAPSELEDDEKKVLAIIAGIKSSYRPAQFERTNLGPYDVNNPLIQKLLNKKLLKANRRGAIQITTEGKNALGDYRVY